MDQLDLFGSQTKRSHRQRVGDATAKHRSRKERVGRESFETFEAAFDALLRRHPTVWPSFHRRALDLLASGVSRISCKHVWELVRLEHPGVSLDNSYTPVCARRLLKVDSRFHGHIELRERKRA